MHDSQTSVKKLRKKISNVSFQTNFTINLLWTLCERCGQKLPHGPTQVLSQKDKRLHVPHQTSGITGTNKVSLQIHRSEQKTNTEGNCGHQRNEPVQAVTIHTAQNCQDFVQNYNPKSAVRKDLKSHDTKTTGKIQEGEGVETLTWHTPRENTLTKYRHQEEKGHVEQMK